MTSEHYARIADLYDEFVQTDFDVPFFVEAAQGVDGTVLELMAGTGRLTLQLLKAGIKVVPVDYAAEMLAVLRDKVDAAGFAVDVQQADVRNFDLGRTFKQIILPFQAFPEITGATDQKQALQSIHRHLDIDGTFIVTLHNPTVRRRYVTGQLQLAGQFPQDDGGVMMVWLLQRYHPTAKDMVEVLEFFEIYDGQGVMVSKRFSSLEFHLLEQVAFEQLLAETGFVVETLYGNYDRSAFEPETSPFMIYILRRS